MANIAVTERRGCAENHGNENILVNSVSQPTALIRACKIFYFYVSRAALILVISLLSPVDCVLLTHFCFL